MKANINNIFLNGKFAFDAPDTGERGDDESYGDIEFPEGGGYGIEEYVGDQPDFQPGEADDNQGN